MMIPALTRAAVADRATGRWAAVPATLIRARHAWHRAIGWRLGAALCAGGLSGFAVVPGQRGWPGWLAWIALVPLFVALDGAGGRVSLALAVTYATALGLAGIGPWLTAAASAYFGLGAWQGTAYALVGLTVLCAGHGLLLGVLLLARPRRFGLSAVFWYGAAWVCWEGLRKVTFPYYPAAVLGLSQYQAPPVIQVASLCGVATVTFVVVAANAGIASLVTWHQKPRTEGSRHITAALGGLGTFLGAIGWGVLRLAADTAALEPAGPDIVLIDIDDRGRTARPVDCYLDVSRQAATAGTALLVWPEHALPPRVVRDRALRRRLLDFVDAVGIPLVAGGAGPGPGSGAPVAGWSRSGHVFGHGVRKTDHERRPGFASRPGRGASMDGRGGPAVFAVGERRFGVLIGVKITDGGAARALARRGAHFIINPANDVWFGGMAWHVPWAVLRAVETGLPVVRAANAGVSLVVDRHGYIVAMREPGGGPAALASWVPVGRPTAYARMGDVLLWACALVIGGGAVGAGIEAWRRRTATQKPALF